MKVLSLAGALLASIATTPALADEPWTETGIYLFASGVSGETQLSNVTADVDLSFSDIMEKLDLGFMGYIEHRRGEWSFIGDLAYLKLTDEDSSTVGRQVEIDLEAELTQTTIAGFGAYRFAENNYDGSDLGIDVLFGARHTTLDVGISLEGSLPSFSASGSRDREEDWVDAVIGVRLESDYRNGWGSLVWLDIGEGSDSSSYNAMILANYATSEWKFYGGWRQLHLEYDSGSGDSKFDVDLDYSGPMVGANYRF